MRGFDSTCKRRSPARETEVTKGVEAMEQLFSASMIPQLGFRKLTMVDCINQFGGALCFDPKDKVLGFQALGTEGFVNKS